MPLIHAPDTLNTQDTTQTSSRDPMDTNKTPVDRYFIDLLASVLT